MPYNNIPKSKTALMDKCVKDVKKSNPDVNPYAICYSSIMKTAIKNHRKKIKNK